MKQEIVKITILLGYTTVAIGLLYPAVFVASLVTFTLYISFPYQLLVWIFVTAFVWGYLTAEISEVSISAVGLTLGLVTVYAFCLMPFDYYFFAPYPVAFLGRVLGNRKHFKWRQFYGLMFSLLLLSYFAFLLFPRTNCLWNCPSNREQNVAISKEIVGVVGGAFTQYTRTHKITPKTSFQDLVSYVNYIKSDTTSNFKNKISEISIADPIRDNIRLLQSRLKKEKEDIGVSLQPCSKQLPCLILYSGAILQYDPKQMFGGTTATHALVVNFDPDVSKVASRASLYLYANGRIMSGAKTLKNTKITTSKLDPQKQDPDYMKWW